MVLVCSNFSAPEGRYTSRPHGYYQDEYSDEEGGTPRGPGSSGNGTNRGRLWNERSQRRHQYDHNQESRKSSHKPGEQKG